MSIKNKNNSNSNKAIKVLSTIITIFIIIVVVLLFLLLLIPLFIVGQITMLYKIIRKIIFQRRKNETREKNNCKKI